RFSAPRKVRPPPSAPSWPGRAKARLFFLLRRVTRPNTGSRLRRDETWVARRRLLTPHSDSAEHELGCYSTVKTLSKGPSAHRFAPRRRSARGLQNSYRPLAW